MSEKGPDMETGFALCVHHTPVKIIPLPFPPFLNSHLATARASDSS